MGLLTEIKGAANQLWNLPATIWKGVPESQELSAITRRSAIAAAVILVGLSLLYNRRKKKLPTHSEGRPLSYGHHYRRRLDDTSTGFDSGMKSDGDSEGYEGKAPIEQKTSRAALGQIGSISPEGKRVAIEEKKQPQEVIGKDAHGKKVIRVLTPEEIVERNRRDFTDEEVDKRLERSFLMAQEDNDEVPIPIYGEISYKQFPKRLDFKKLGIGYYKNLTEKVLKTDKFPLGASMQGLRDGMEDRHVLGDFSLPLKGRQSLPIRFFSLFDGRAGDKCSQFFATNIQSFAKAALATVDFDQGATERTRVVNTLTKLFIPMTEAYLRTKDNWAKGAAIAVFQIRNRLYVANAGNSRAIIIDRKGSTKVFALSKDHRPEDNQKNVEIRGGRIDFPKDHVPVVSGPWWDETRGEGSGVSMARGVGYPEIGTGVNPRAEVIEYLLEESDEPQFLVICCDGVWDVMSTNEVGALVLKHKNKPPADIAEIIIKQAYCQTSEDNLTAIVVPLNRAAQFPNEEGSQPSESTAIVAAALAFRSV